jgi:hypothetical protein
MPQYMLLLYNDPAWFTKLSPEEMQKATEKYMAWTKNAFVKGGQRLAWDPVKVMRQQTGTVRTTDGPYSESKEALGGYYAIEAASMEEAIKRTKDNPHLEYGGTIEVRHIFGT